MIKKIALLTIAGLMLTGCYATTNQVKKDMIVVGGCASGGLIGSNGGCKLGKVAADKVVDKNQ